MQHRSFLNDKPDPLTNTLCSFSVFLECIRIDLHIQLIKKKIFNFLLENSAISLPKTVPWQYID